MLAVLEGVDPDRLLKSGTSLAGEPVRLSDGRRVGRVLSTGRAPAPFRVGRRVFPSETPVTEIEWNSAEFGEVAKDADLRLRDDKVLLLGDDAPPVEKSVSQRIRDLALGRVERVVLS